MKDGTQKLAELINSRIQTVVQGRESVVAELGKIKANGSLAVNSLTNEIPQGSYYIAGALAKKKEEKGYITQSGESVLVIWVGSLPIAIDTVT